MPSFHIIVFGCQMNYSDAARIKSVLQNAGFTFSPNKEEADIIIFDTCSVRQKAEDKVTGALKDIPSHQKVWITGCMVQHHLRHSKIAKQSQNKKISGLMKVGNFVGTIKTKDPIVKGWKNADIRNGIDQKDADNIVYVNHAFNPLFFSLSQKHDQLELMFRIDDTGFLPLMLEELGYQVSPDIEVTNEYARIIPEGTNQLMKNNTKTAYVPISTGCSQFCAFCIVPYARGLEKHLPVDDIIREVKHHIDAGVQEITLLGQIVNKHPHFVEICRRILDLPGDLQWLRYTSPYPTYYSDELLALHEQEERMCPHIHMPLQSGSSRVLKKMFRGYNREQFIEFVDKIRGLKRSISITTDVIVGFTDETDEDFEDTLSLVKYAKFDMIYIGKYSVRPGTYAARKYDDTIDPTIKQQRREVLNETLKKLSASNNIMEHSQKRQMIVQNIQKGRCMGYTDNMKNVVISLPDDAIYAQENKRASFAPKAKNAGYSKVALDDRTIELGQYLPVYIYDSEPFKLFGRYI